MGADYAIIDVETTGFFPGRHHRVLEIAVIRTTPSGDIVGEFSSLVNPMRDVGPTPVHGIRASDVVGAPTFDSIMGDVVSLLSGATLVAHNALFDMRFLDAELERANVHAPQYPYLCTLKLSRLVDGELPSRKLGDLCDHFGIAAEHPHSAQGDACATRDLLFALVSRLHHAPTPDREGSAVTWPRIEPRGIAHTRDQAERDTLRQSSFISALVARLPAHPDPRPELDDYHTLLDRVLEDRRITAEEATSLEELATELHLSRDQATSIHRDYMKSLVTIALEDGIVTATERRDLGEVSRLLGFSAEELDVLLAAEPAAPQNLPAVDLHGKTVCFTGTLCGQINGAPIERAFAAESAERNGMVVARAVTKKLDILVVADPDSMSSKARKAREYGVRVIAEPVFWRLIGVAVD